MAEELVRQFGYWGLFLISFLSATVLPLSTELAVLLMPRLGYSVWGVGVVATAGNYVGSMTSYYAGRQGGDFVFARYFQEKPERIERAKTWFARYGSPLLFFTWMPFIGDLLSVVAGMLKYNPVITSFWIVVGKGLRAVVLLGIAGFLW